MGECSPYLLAKTDPIFELLAEEGRSMLRPYGWGFRRDFVAFLALY